MCLVVASVVVGVGLWRVGSVQSETVTVGGQTFGADSVGLALRGERGVPRLVNLNGALDREVLSGVLAPAVPDAADRAAVIAGFDDTFGARDGGGRGVPNVGALATLEPDSAMVADFRVQPDSVRDDERSVRVARSPGADSTRIEGRVTNVAGDGLQGIYVSLEGPAGSRRVQTSPGGEFGFDGLTHTEWYTVRPQYSGYVFEPLGMPSPPDTTRTDSLTVEAGSLVVEAGGDVTFVGRRYPTAEVAGRLGRVKSSLIVRTPDEFRSSLAWAAGLFFLAFFGVHGVWRYGARLWGGRPWTGDPYLLPIVLALSGLGFFMMVSVQDPLRDLLHFVPFVQGVGAACAGLAVFGLVDAQRAFRPRQIRLGRASISRGVVTWAPLVVAAVLFAALTLFGTGPTGSDAKVNLGPLQPSEIIKVLVVFGLAGLLSRYHDRLLALRQRHVSVGGHRLRIGWLGLPRLRDVGLMLAVVVVALGMFVVQSDVGPALILAATALALYGIARRDAVVPALGFGLMALGFWGVHAFDLWEGTTRSDRLEMMANTWDNYLANGVQLAEAHWALATGGVWGLGLGRGAPGLIPAGHTDMVLAGVGEELGFLRLALVFGLYGVLVWRGLRGALAARGPFTFFLGVGLALLLGFQLVLIVGGVLGLVPLSGVVSPFVSFGRTSMAMNGLIVGLLASITAHGVVAERNEQTAPYARGVRVVGLGLAVVGALYLVRLADLQVVRADEVAVRPALVRTGDGSRAFVYNGRIFRALREIPRGTIRDRNGLVLAADDCEEIREQAEAFRRPPFEKDIEDLCGDARERYYPLGADTFYLIGDRETRLYQADTSRTTPLTFVEFDEETNRRLQGYDDFARDTLIAVHRGDPDSLRVRRQVRDFREIVPLMRMPGPDRSAEAEALVQRDRDVRLSLDAALQVHAGQVLTKAVGELETNVRDRPMAAAVVVDPRTGEVLAAATSPLPTAAVEDPASVQWDSEMRDRAFGWEMAPASTFKALLAMAALERDADAMERRYPCHGTSDLVDMERALILSCNEYFKGLVREAVGRQGVVSALRAFEIKDVPQGGEPSSFDQLGIGQGRLQASVADMAMVAAAVANGGVRRGPTLIAGAETDGDPFVEARVASWVGGAMRRVVTDPAGTAYKTLSGFPVPIAGKTGTGQYVVDGRRVNRSWFIGYGPYGGRAPLAVAVVVDAGGGGGLVAAPPAARILEFALRGTE